VGDPRLAGVGPASPHREHRLYQADWLLRAYKFTRAEVMTAVDKSGNLSLKKNPKVVIAERRPWLYPVDINRASFDELLRVPGIGPISAERIVAVRRQQAIGSMEQLGKLRVRYREAAPYIWFKGRTDWEKQLSFLPQIEEEPEPEPAGLARTLNNCQ
jgi:predicted DNA-binding helix-hairpin-helix protein